MTTETRKKALNDFLIPINEALTLVGHGGEISGETLHIPKHGWIPL